MGLIPCACGCGELIQSVSKYGRKTRFKHPHYAKTLSIPLEESFWKNVLFPTTEYSCWEWIGAKNDVGYAQIRHKNKIYYGHRLSYEFHTGIRLTKKQHVLHGCDNPSCVNPEHLSIGSPCENLHDAMTKGRMAGNPVTDENVINIRKLHAIGGYKQYEIASLFGATQSNASRIVNNITRKDVACADL